MHITVCPLVLCGRSAASSEICGGDQRVECGLLFGFVTGDQEPQRFHLVGCAEAFVFAGGVVFDVETAIAATSIQSELLRHNLFHVMRLSRLALLPLASSRRGLLSFSPPCARVSKLLAASAGNCSQDQLQPARFQRVPVERPTTSLGR